MAIAFDGTDDYYVTTSTPVAAAPLTFAVWASPGADGNFYALSISDTSESTETLSVRQNVTTRNMTMRAESAVGDTDQSVTGTMVTGTFSHICGTSTGSANRLGYLDGVAGTANTATNAPANLDRIGLGSSGDSVPAAAEWNGDLFWPAIWNVDLSAAEVGHLANGASPLTIRRSNLVYFARIADISFVYDMIGGLSHTLSGNPTDASDPSGVKRITGRGRGRHRMRI